MCDCKKELEIRLTEKFAERSPEATDHAVEMQGYGLVVIDGSMEQMGYMPVEATAMFPLKSGGKKYKTVKQTMFFSYCPFCGVKS